MRPLPRLAALALLAPLAGCIPVDSLSAPSVERTETHRFRVDPHSVADIHLRGGSITTEPGPAGTLVVSLKARVRADSEQEADAILREYGIAVVQDGGRVTVDVHPRAGDWSLWQRRHVQVSARLEVPADLRLILETSGGSIVARGPREDALDARTSGGSITADGGRGEMSLATSGGSIRVGQVLSRLDARTSGGSVAVDQIGRSADRVALRTSGGSIRVGVDPDAALTLDAGTSGGTVQVRDLDFAGLSDRSRFSGTINGGGGQLLAHTSGGSVSITARR